jgi:hypothetical protein
MGFYRIGKEREAIPQRGEDYRSVVAKYLQSKGLRIDAESPIEGSFEDIVCFESATAKVFIETKGTEVSLHSRRFLEPLCVYFSRFVRLPRQARFRTLFFFEGVTDKDAFRAVFHDLQATAVAELKRECSVAVRRMAESGGRRELLDPATCDYDEFLEFLDSVDVYEGDVQELERATKLRESGTVASSSALVIAGPIASAEALRNAAIPDEVAETLTADMLEVVRFPMEVVGVPDDSGSEAEVGELDEARVVRLRGVSKGGIRYFLSRPPERFVSSRPLAPIQASSLDWLRDPDKKRWLQELVLQYLGVYCSKKGLLQGTNAHRFIFVPEGDQGLSATWFPGHRKRQRDVVQKRRGRDGTVFFAHKALDIAFVVLGEQLFLQLESTWEFTSDGRHFLTAKIGGPLRREWRRGERNRSRLVDLIFWTKFLCGTRGDIRIPAGEDEIHVSGTPVSFELDYGIKDDRLDLDRLLDTPHEYRFAASRRGLATEENLLEPWISDASEEAEDSDAA